MNDTLCCSKIKIDKARTDRLVYVEFISQGSLIEFQMAIV